LERAEKKTKKFLEKKFAATSVVVDEARTEGISPLIQVVVRGTFVASGIKKSFEITFESGLLCRMIAWRVKE
jgi:hypothetical protein